MNYLESASPKTGGYKESAYPEGDYSKSEGGKEGTFTEMSPHTLKDGYGEYHINHFVAYFKTDNLSKNPVSQEHFFQNFPEIFNKDLPEKEKGLIKNEFTAIKTKYKFNNNGTIMFLMKDLRKAVLHQDWISIQKGAESKSFYARTLKREWNVDVIDNDLVNPLLNLLKVIATGSGITIDKEYLKGVNHQHFLAGRRSWAFGKEGNLYYVETAAFERYSHFLYRAVEGILGLKEGIVDIWIKLIMNFSAYYQVKLLPIFTKEKILEGYTSFKKTNILYNQAQTKTPDEALNLPWFSKVLARHPGLKNI